MSRLQCLDLKFVFRLLNVAGVIGKYRLSIGCRYYSKVSDWGTKKSGSLVKLVYYPEGMADPQVEVILAPLRADVKKQVSV
jgi:hypothetical protein